MVQILLDQSCIESQKQRLQAVRLFHSVQALGVLFKHVHNARYMPRSPIQGVSWSSYLPRPLSRVVGASCLRGSFGGVAGCGVA